MIGCTSVQFPLFPTRIYVVGIDEKTFHWDSSYKFP